MKRVLSLVVGLLIAGVIQASPINFPAAGVKMDTPKGWKYEIAKDANSIQVTSPDELVSIVFIPLDAKTIKAGLDAAEKQILADVPDAEFGDAQSLKINGMDAIEVAGTGTLDGTAVTISVSVIIGKKPLMVLAYTAEGGEANDEALANFVNTIKKL